MWILSEYLATVHIRKQCFTKCKVTNFSTQICVALSMNQAWACIVLKPIRLVNISPFYFFIIIYVKQLTNRIDSDWSGSSSYIESTTGSNIIGSLCDFIADDSNSAHSTDSKDSVHIPDMQTSILSDNSNLGRDPLSQAEGEMRCDIRLREFWESERIASRGRAIDCSKALLQAIERINPEGTSLRLSVHITGEEGRYESQYRSEVRIERCDCILCGVEQLHIAVPHQCQGDMTPSGENGEHLHSPIPAESRPFINKANSLTSEITKGTGHT